MTSIEKICFEVYGVGVVACDPLTILWAADKIEDTELVKKEINKVNKLRENGAKCLAMFPTVIVCSKIYQT